jgi:hypothetical protein
MHSNYRKIASSNYKDGKDLLNRGQTDRETDRQTDRLQIYCDRCPYPSNFGGAAIVRRDHFEKINGISNLSWGWGGEDDEISAR